MAQKKVLVVDDDPDMLKVTRIRLESEGYETIGCRSGLKAIGLVRKDKPDIVILDLFLPDMNGDRITKTLKNDDKTKDVPVVLVSSAVTSIGSKARECGADGHLIKGFEPEELLGMIKRLTNSVR